jgi:hypothetical protein
MPGGIQEILHMDHDSEVCHGFFLYHIYSLSLHMFVEGVVLPDTNAHYTRLHK